MGFPPLFFFICDKPLTTVLLVGSIRTVLLAITMQHLRQTQTHISTWKLPEWADLGCWPCASKPCCQETHTHTYSFTCTFTMALKIQQLHNQNWAHLHIKYSLIKLALIWHFDRHVATKYGIRASHSRWTCPHQIFPHSSSLPAVLERIICHEFVVWLMYFLFLSVSNCYDANKS